jgi:hypothetical protein
MDILKLEPKYLSSKNIKRISRSSDLRKTYYRRHKKILMRGGGDSPHTLDNPYHQFAKDLHEIRIKFFKYLFTTPDDLDIDLDFVDYEEPSHSEHFTPLMMDVYKYISRFEKDYINKWSATGKLNIDNTIFYISMANDSFNVVLDIVPSILDSSDIGKLEIAQSFNKSIRKKLHDIKGQGETNHLFSEKKTFVDWISALNLYEEFFPVIKRQRN